MEVTEYVESNTCIHSSITPALTPQQDRGNICNKKNVSDIYPKYNTQVWRVFHLLVLVRSNTLNKQNRSPKKVTSVLERLNIC